MFRKGLDKNGGRKHTGSKQASKQASITAPFFLVKSTIAYFSKAYSARFYTDGVRLFVLPDKQYNFFLIEFTA